MNYLESMRPTPLSETRIMKVANCIVKNEAMKLKNEGDKKLARRATIFIGNLKSV